MKEFFDDIRLEWKEKLTWPTAKEMKQSTTQVFVFMLILTLFFAAVDGVISVSLAAVTGTEDAYEEEYDYEDYDLDELLDDDAEADDVEDGDED